MEINEKKKFYRYHDTYGEHCNSIDLQVFVELRETECGHWIIPNYYAENPISAIKERLESVKKWVSKTSVRRHAYPEKSQAFNAFVKRKQHQIRMNNIWLRQAERALRLAKLHEECPEWFKNI